MTKLNEPFQCAESETGWAKMVENNNCYMDGTGMPCVYAAKLHLGEPCGHSDECGDDYTFIPCDPPEGWAEILQRAEEQEEAISWVKGTVPPTLAEALEVIERADGYLKNSQNTRGGCYCALEGKCGLCILRDDVEAILKKAGRI